MSVVACVLDLIYDGLAADEDRAAARDHEPAILSASEINDHTRAYALETRWTETRAWSRFAVGTENLATLASAVPTVPTVLGAPWRHPNRKKRVELC